MAYAAKTLEKHWRIPEVAAQLGLSRQTVTRMVQNDPRVRVLGAQDNQRGKQRYRVFLIPDSVMQDYLKQMTTGGMVIERAG